MLGKKSTNFKAALRSFVLLALPLSHLSSRPEKMSWVIGLAAGLSLWWLLEETRKDKAKRRERQREREEKAAQCDAYGCSRIRAAGKAFCCRVCFESTSEYKANANAEREREEREREWAWACDRTARASIRELNERASDRARERSEEREREWACHQQQEGARGQERDENRRGERHREREQEGGHARKKEWEREQRSGRESP